MSSGLYGPFENFEEVEVAWYQVTEKELEESIEKVKKYKSQKKMFADQLNKLRSFVEDYTRCIARYKFESKTLEQINDDWKEYNLSLYLEWNRYQAWILNPDDSKESLEESRRQTREEEIKREEIEKRIRGLLLNNK